MKFYVITKIFLILIVLNSLNVTPTAGYDDSPYALWQMKAISFTPAVSNITKGSPDVVVVIMDTGIDFSHYDLGTQLRWKNPGEISGLPFIDDDGNGYVDDYYGWDFVENDNDPSPFLQNITGDGKKFINHATAICGIIAGQGEDVLGIVPKIKIMDIKIFNTDGSVHNISRALSYIETMATRFNNIKVINYSGVFGNKTMQEAISTINRLIYELDVNFVASAGNSFSKIENVSIPASHPGIISVGAIDEDLEISTFSQRGSELDFVAPGENVFSLAVNNQVNNNWDGTSLSAPFLSGAIAYLLSLSAEHKLGNINRIDIFNHLTNATTDLGMPGKDSVYGFGLLNMSKLVSSLKISSNSQNGILYEGSYISLKASFEFLTPIITILFLFRKKIKK